MPNTPSASHLCVTNRSVLFGRDSGFCPNYSAFHPGCDDDGCTLKMTLSVDRKIRTPETPKPEPSPKTEAPKSEKLRLAQVDQVCRLPVFLLGPGRRLGSPKGRVCRARGASGFGGWAFGFGSVLGIRLSGLEARRAPGVARDRPHLV